MRQFTKFPLFSLTSILLLAWCTNPSSAAFCYDPASCCGGYSDGTVFASWDNCNIYYGCYTDEAIEFRCSNSSLPLFDPDTLQCTLTVSGCSGGTRPPTTTTPRPTTTTPTTTTPPTTTSTTPSPGHGNCTEDGVYFIPFPGECSKFMICANHELLPEVQECPPGTLFDPEIAECNREDLVHCRPICPPTGTVSLPHDRNCSLYWICTAGQPTMRQCASGLVFDPELGVCNMEELVFCPNLCPEQGLVNLPYPGNCTLYWLCLNGHPSLRQCAPDLAFDPKLGMCNLDVECDTQYFIHFQKKTFT